MKIDHHTPAFPLPLGAETTEGGQGMTLRQYYAGEAMKALLPPYNEGNGRDNVSGIPKEAFCIADAMLAASGGTEDIEKLKADIEAWSVCASDMEVLVKDLQRAGNEHPFSVTQQDIIVALLQRFQDTNSKY